MITPSTSWTGVAAIAIVLTLATGCAGTARKPAAVQGNTATGNAVPAGVTPPSDSPGWRRIHAGAGRT